VSCPTAPRYCYLRLSVTDRCNNRCRYCMPTGGATLAPHEDILRYEEFLRAADLINRVRPLRKIRVTGGEPLIRRNLPSFIGRLHGLFPQGTELALTTNGRALADLAPALAAAGLSRVNVSLDTLDPRQFHRSTRATGLDTVVAGIDAALGAGLGPVKVNSVLQRTINLDRITDLVAFAADRGSEIRFIELMRIGPARKLVKREYVSMDEALERIRQRWPGIEPLAGGENSRRYLVQTDNGPARVGFITPVSHPFCSTCDRLRLDAQGRLYSCLRNSERLDLRELLRNGTDDRWIRGRIGEVLAGKGLPGDRWSERTRMSSMGG